MFYTKTYAKTVYLRTAGKGGGGRGLNTSVFSVQIFSLQGDELVHTALLYSLCFGVLGIVSAASTSSQVLIYIYIHFLKFVFLFRDLL